MTNRPSFRPLPAWLGAALGLLVLAVGVWPLLTLSLDPDIAWLLHVAAQVLDGASYGVDVVEVNPPLIVWFSMVPVLLERATGLPATALYHVVVALLAGATAGWAARLFRRHPQLGPVGLAGWAGLGLLALLALPAGLAFGQREHLAVMAVLPYLLLAGVRGSGGGVVARGPAVAAGAVAGLGFALKPYFLIPLLLVELAVRRQGVRTLRAETLALAATGLGYAAAALLLHPHWLASARELAPLYRGYLVPSVEQFLAPGTVAVAVAVVVAAVWLPLAPARPVGRRWSSPVAAALAGFALSALLQWKVWPYLFVPVAALGTLTLGLLALEAPRSAARPVARVAWWIAAATAALMAVGVVREGAFWAGSGVGALGPAGAEHRELVDRVRRAAAGRPIAVLTTNHLFSFPLATEVGTGWALRHPSLWPLTAIRAAELDPAPEPIGRRSRPPDPREERLLQQLAADLERTRPGVLVVPIPAPTVDAWGYARRFDYEALLGSEPRLAAILGRYTLADSVNGFRLYVGER